MTNNTISLKHFTELPVKEITYKNKTAIGALITTPHKGEVVIDYQKEVFVGFIFGHSENKNKRAEEIIREIINLEQESREFLFKKWLKNQTP